MEAINIHRIAHALYGLGVPVIPRMLDGVIFLLFNSVIHHETEIGKGTRCGYRGMSVLIHRKATIGQDVMFGAHVVVGGRSGQAPPVIEDGAYIGANACILGSVVVGRAAVVGAGAVVVSDVPAGVTVAGNPARIVAVREGARASQ